MLRVNLNRSEVKPDFIGSWMMSERGGCDGIVDYFERNQAIQRKGTTGGGVDLVVKNSVDVTVLPKEILAPGNEVVEQYFQWLHGCYKDYLEQWPFFASMAKGLEVGSFNIQRYRSGQHFQKIHTERDGIGSLHRVLAWMTYLNDVAHDAGGATYFEHYDLAVQPKKGLTLIWPAEWTHAHRGELLKSGSKYVITGWIHFTQ
jgi:prolyl 4-hydroxylase